MMIRRTSDAGSKQGIEATLVAVVSMLAVQWRRHDLLRGGAKMEIM